MDKGRTRQSVRETRNAKEERKGHQTQEMKRRGGLESFDFISFGAVLEHLYDPDFAISRALQWLKPDGLIHLEVPSANWLVRRSVNAYFRLRKGECG